MCFLPCCSGKILFIQHASLVLQFLSQMPSYCVVAGCYNQPNVKEGIILHGLPFADDPRPEARKRRRKWIEFVRLKRVFNVTSTSAVCSVHFKPEDFKIRFHKLPELGKPIMPRLERDEIGVIAVPSIQAIGQPNMQPQSQRSRRMVCNRVFTFSE